MVRLRGGGIEGMDECIGDFEVLLWGSVQLGTRMRTRAHTWEEIDVGAGNKGIQWNGKLEMI